MDLLIGTLTRIGGPGIACVRLQQNGFELLWHTASFTDPNWISQGPGKRLFAVSSDIDAPEKGCVNEIECTGGGVRLISRQPTGGNAPCHLCFSQDGRFMLAANYASGSVAVYPLETACIGERLQLIQHTGSSVHPTRQAAPHVHQITQIPHLAGYYCAVDLGIDALVVYKQNSTSGTLAEQYRVQLPPGCGPRHIAYDTDGTGLLVTELSNQIFKIHFMQNSGSISDMLPTIASTQRDSYAAAIYIHSGNRCAYVSNRGEDSIAVFSTSPLRKVGLWHHVGKYPRDFLLLSDASAVVACQNEGLILYDGGKQKARLSMPGCVRVLQLG